MLFVLTPSKLWLSVSDEIWVSYFFTSFGWWLFISIFIKGIISIQSSDLMAINCSMFFMFTLNPADSTTARAFLWTNINLNHPQVVFFILLAGIDNLVKFFLKGIFYFGGHHLCDEFGQIVYDHFIVWFYFQ